MKKGYIAITSVLIITALVLILGSASALLSVNSLQSVLSAYFGRTTLDAVESCAEDALLRLNNNNTLPASITLPDGTVCTILTNSQVGTQWDFTLNTTVTTHTTSIRIVTERSGTIQITSWKEI